MEIVQLIIEQISKLFMCTAKFFCKDCDNLYLYQQYMRLRISPKWHQRWVLLFLKIHEDHLPTPECIIQYIFLRRKIISEEKQHTRHGTKLKPGNSHDESLKMEALMKKSCFQHHKEQEPTHCSEFPRALVKKETGRGRRVCSDQYPRTLTSDSQPEDLPEPSSFRFPGARESAFKITMKPSCKCFILVN